MMDVATAPDADKREGRGGVEQPARVDRQTGSTQQADEHDQVRKERTRGGMLRHASSALAHAPRERPREDFCGACSSHRFQILAVLQKKAERLVHHV